MKQVRFTKLQEGAIAPSKATTGAAAYDICAPEDVKIEANGVTLIGTGIAIELPIGTCALVLPRSGNSVKGMPDQYDNRHPETIVRTGLIDPDYRGSIGVIVDNTSCDQSYIIPKGQRVAQLLVQRYEEVFFVESDALSETDRGAKGFGSTGK